MKQQRHHSDCGVIGITSSVDDIKEPRKKFARYDSGIVMDDDDASIPALIAPNWQTVLEPEELTPEEQDRMRRRKEKNRKAAEKCRKKKKEREVLLEEEADKLQEQNEGLLEQIDTLKEDRERLKFYLQSHALSCGLRHQSFTSLTTSSNQLSNELSALHKRALAPSLRDLPQDINHDSSLTFESENRTLAVLPSRDELEIED